jgi:hypothetical protein
MFRRRHGRIDWPNAQRLLLALVEELKAKELEHGAAAPAGHALDQVWIDRNWDLRLLDEPVGHPPFAHHPPVGLVREAARALFLGTEDGMLVLPPDLPVHAEMIVTRLMSEVAPFEDLAAVRDALMKLSSGPAIVQQRTRGAQLSINVFLPAAILFVMVVGGIIIGALFAKSRGVSSMLGELDTGRIDMGEDTTAEQHAESTPLSDDQRRAREILVAYAFNAFGANLIEAQMNPKEHALIDAALALHPEPSEEEIQWAEGAVRAETGRSAHARQKNVNKAIMLIPAAVMGLVGVGLWGMIALPLALILRGGLTFLLFGIRVRNKRGEPASRILCFVRCLVCWLPLALGSVAVYVLTDENHVMAAAIVAGVFVLTYVAALADAVVHPAQCVVDRLLKTRLVPR